MFRKLQDRLEYHGVDYHAAAAAASSYADVTDFVASEKVRGADVAHNYFSQTLNCLIDRKHSQNSAQAYQEEKE